MIQLPRVRKDHFLILIQRAWSGQDRRLGRTLGYRMGLLLSLVVALSGCSPSGQARDEIVVFAAASLQDALVDVSADFESMTGTQVQMNFAASGALSEQILAGAEADVFITADQEWISSLEDSRRVVPESKLALLSNSLVVISNANTDWSLKSIKALPALPFRHLVLGDPNSVPAGRHAQRYLQSVSTDGGTLWDTVRDRVAPTADVRRVVSLVESDQSLLGIVYATDAAISKQVRIVHPVPKSAVEVNYFVVAIRPMQASDALGTAASSYCQWLKKPASQSVFHRYGFGGGAPAKYNRSAR